MVMTMSQSDYESKVGQRYEANLELFRKYASTTPQTLITNWASPANNRIENFAKQFGDMDSEQATSNPNNIFQINLHALMANRVAQKYEAEGAIDKAKHYYEIAQTLFQKTALVSDTAKIGAAAAENNLNRVNLPTEGFSRTWGVIYALGRILGKIVKPALYLVGGIAVGVGAAFAAAAIGGYFFAGSFAVGPTALIGAATAHAGLISAAPVAAAAVGHFFASGMMVPAAMTAISGMPLGFGILASIGLGFGIGAALVGAFFLLKAAWNGLKSSGSMIAEGYTHGAEGVKLRSDDNFFTPSKNNDIGVNLASETAVLFKAQEEAMKKQGLSVSTASVSGVRSSISDLAAAARQSTSVDSSSLRASSSVSSETDHAIGASHESTLRSRRESRDVELATRGEREHLLSSTSHPS